jgi:hypothetical protein
MTWFQITFLPIGVLLSLISLRRFLRGGRGRRIALLSLFVWTAAVLAVAWPDLTTRIARILGIGRGADLLIYLLSLAFAVSAFHFYNRVHQLESSITDLVREIALREATERVAEPREKERV